METGKITIENTNGDFNFGLLVSAFLEYQIVKEEFKGVNPSDPSKVNYFMHEYMKDLVENIATSISEYGKSQGYNLSFNYYKKLAWLGLEKNLELIMFDDEDIDNEEEVKLDTVQNFGVKTCKVFKHTY